MESKVKIEEAIQVKKKTLTTVVKCKEAQKPARVQYFICQANDRNEVVTLFDGQQLKTALKIGKAKYLVSFSSDGRIPKSHPRLTPCLPGQGEQFIAKVLKALGIYL